MSGVAVREYASAEEMLAAYRARKRPPVPVVTIAPEPEPEPVRPAPEPKQADDLALYREAFENAIPPENPYRVAKAIIAAVSEETGISVQRIRSRWKIAPIALARQECMYRIARETSLSSTQIGRIFDRDHTTVIHALQKMSKIHGIDVRTEGRTPEPLLIWRKMKEAASKAEGQP